MRYIKLLRSSAMLLILLALMACTSTPPQASTTTREVSDPTPTLTKTALPTATHTPTPTRTPTIAHTSTPTTIPPTAYTPSPTPGPIKPILLEFGTTGGDGGTSDDVFFGREMPSLVLYTDGQLLMGDFSYTDPGGYFQTSFQRKKCAPYFDGCKRQVSLMWQGLDNITQTIQFTRRQNTSVTGEAVIYYG